MTLCIFMQHERNYFYFAVVYILAFFLFLSWHSSHFSPKSIRHYATHCMTDMALLFVRYAVHSNNVIPVVCVHSCFGDSRLTKQVVSYLIQESG